MEHQTAVKSNQADSQNQASCCAKSDSNSPDSIQTFRDLHQRIGNQAVGDHIQAKLKIGEPNDHYEQEADRVADQVMRMPDLPKTETVSSDVGAPQLQRKCAHCAEAEIQRKASEEEEEEEEHEEETAGPIKRKAIDGDANENNSRLESGFSNFEGGGQPLPASLRAFFEPRFGHDFSGVRVHTDSRASRAADAVNAIAFTRGRDIVFAEGSYSSESSSGRKLLAHELTHVVQQASRAVEPHSVQRTVRVGPNAAARSEMRDLFNFLCPTGNFTISGQRIVSGCAAPSGPSCECLCDATTDTARTYRIDVRNAVRNDRLETLHDGSTVTIPDTSVGPHTRGGTNPSVVMTKSSSAMEFAVFRPDCTPIWAPNWRILGHELCGHGRLNQSYTGGTGNRPLHDATIDTENAIAAEHGEPARGHFTDPRQGESATNPVGDRSRLLFRQTNGWHFEPPLACVAPTAPSPPPPGPSPPSPASSPTAPPPASPPALVTPPAFRWTASALGGLETTELQGLAGLGLQVSPLRNGPLLVFNPMIGLNVVYSPSTEFQPQEFMLVMADIGLRIQQPVRGAYFDLSAGGFMGFEAETRGGTREFAGGLGGGVGAGWRWERVELGAEARALFPVTDSDPARILVLGRFGYRFGEVR